MVYRRRGNTAAQQVPVDLIQYTELPDLIVSSLQSAADHVQHAQLSVEKFGQYFPDNASLYFELLLGRLYTDPEPCSSFNGSSLKPSKLLLRTRVDSNDKRGKPDFVRFNLSPSSSQDYPIKTTRRTRHEAM